MEKVVRITTLKDRQTDFKYWQTKTPEERLAAIEFLRQQYIKYLGNVSERLQRVCRVIEKK
jgi:hypothetical protein